MTMYMLLLTEYQVSYFTTIQVSVYDNVHVVEMI